MNTARLNTARIAVHTHFIDLNRNYIEVNSA